MALQGPIPVDFAQVFPRGVFAAGPFEPVRDFEASKGDRFVQSKDKHTGLPLWVAEVIDGDPSARQKSLRVKVAAAGPAGAARAASGDAVHPGGVRRADGDPVCQPGRAAGLLAQGGRGAPGGPPEPRTRRGHGGVSTGGAAGTAIPAAPGISPGQQTVERGLDPSA